MRRSIPITNTFMAQSVLAPTGTSFFIAPRASIVLAGPSIEFHLQIEDALKDDTELRKNVKRVLEVILGLLKDRALGSEEPATKKRRVEEIIKKK